MREDSESGRRRVWVREEDKVSQEGGQCGVREDRMGSGRTVRDQGGGQSGSGRRTLWVREEECVSQGGAQDGVRKKQCVSGGTTG